MTSLSSEEIRRLVREVLKEALPQAKGNGAATAQAVSVNIGSDADLNAFAREIARMDEHARAAIIAGERVFSLRGHPHAQPANNGARGGGTHRIDKGLLTETMVVEIGRANSRIIVGKSVAVTPLARDKAREVKLEIVRDKP